MRVAIVGAGISGLGTAWLLHKQGHRTTLFEANDYLGGHTHTVDVTLDGVSAPVDTGFLVFNDVTYPNLIALFDELKVRSTASSMSFSVRNDTDGVEWAGTSIAALFAQPANVARREFWSMLFDVARFNRAAKRMAIDDNVFSVSLNEYLEAENFGRPFRDWYLLPMAAAIWSAGKRDILDFPLPTFIRFCHNHGLLQIFNRPRWRTVVGGGREYVQRIVARLSDVRVADPVRQVRRTARGVEIDSANRRSERFDHVVLACHSDQALQALADATTAERELLRAVRYQKNRVVLHIDSYLLPRSRRAWSSWNYFAAAGDSGDRQVAVSYWINRLQPLPFTTPLFITLNPPIEPQARSIIAEFEYSHPLLDSRALSAQERFARLQGVGNTWYAGAWLGYGFHEDGLNAALSVAAGIARRTARSTSERAAA